MCQRLKKNIFFNNIFNKYTGTVDLCEFVCHKSILTVQTFLKEKKLKYLTYPNISFFFKGDLFRLIFFSFFRLQELSLVKIRTQTQKDQLLQSTTQSGHGTRLLPAALQPRRTYLAKKTFIKRWYKK